MLSDRSDTSEAPRGAGSVGQEHSASADGEETAARRAEATRLILAAFADARASGREDWTRMTAAVLKNRLLDMTQRSFAEETYGAANLADFVALFPELLDVVETTPQRVVRLRDASLVDAVAPSSVEGSPTKPLERVRPDLWRAIVDYSSGLRYVWDEEIENAVPRPETASNARELPTISRDTVQEWRSDFVRHALVDAGSPHEAQLQEWLARGYGTSFLPPLVQGEWNGYVRDRVVERLRGFFNEHGLDIPADLLIGADMLRAQRRRSEPDKRLEQLRQLVTRCVAVMTAEELSSLEFSPDIWLRMEQDRR